MVALEGMAKALGEISAINKKIIDADKNSVSFEVGDNKWNNAEKALYQGIVDAYNKERGKVVFTTKTYLGELFQALQEDILHGTKQGQGEVLVRWGVVPPPKPTEIPTRTPPPSQKPRVQVGPADITYKPITAVSQKAPARAEVTPAVINRPSEGNDNLAIAKRIVDMIIYFEGPGGTRQYDIGGYDIGGGINTGGFTSIEERNFVLAGHTDWFNTFIPKNHVKECVIRLLTIRITLTRERYKARTGRDDFDTLPSNVQAVLVDLHYNMPSVSAPGKFPQFWDAIKAKNWKEAGRQLIDNGEGTPSKYLKNVLGRAYANAMMLTEENQEYRQHKNKAERAGSAEAIFDLYNQENGKYERRFSRAERREELQAMSTVADLLEVTTSSSAMSSRGILGDKGSTRAIIDVLEKFIDQHSRGPSEKAALEGQIKEQLKIKFGNFKRAIFEDGSAMGAFQQWCYLEYGKDAFKKDVQYIDGTKGPLIETAFMRECYKIRGADILRKIQSQADIRGLPQFERDILLANLPRETIDVTKGSSPDTIKKAKILIILNHIDDKSFTLTLDNSWNEGLQNMLNFIPKLSSTERFDRARVNKILSQKYEIKDGQISMLEGLRGCAIAGAWNLAKQLGNPNDLVITGGTEGGHAPNSFGSDEYTHEGGYKIDLRVTKQLKNFTGLKFGDNKIIEIEGQNVRFYYHGINPHFDVTFYPTQSS